MSVRLLGVYVSLYVYSGVPGSGKSYHACRDIITCRYPVITNMRVSGKSNVAVMDLRDIKPRLLMAYSLFYFQDHKFKENSLLLVIDEAQLLFNSRTWDSDDRFDWLEFLSQHRHYGYKVVLVAQDISMIDKQFRCLCEFDCRHTSSGSISALTRGLHMLGLKLTCAKYYFYDSDVLISRDFYHISKRVYSHYDTRQDLLGNDFAGVDVSPIADALAASGAEGAERPGSRPQGRLSRLLSRFSGSDTLECGKGSEIASESLSGETAA